MKNKFKEETAVLEDIFDLLDKEGLNPKYIKKSVSGFSRWIEFETKYQKCWIKWYVDVASLRVGDMYGIRIPFTHMEVDTCSPFNRRNLTFANNHAEKKFGLADIEVELVLEKLDWQEKKQ